MTTKTKTEMKISHRPPTFGERLVALSQYARFEIKIWFYAILHVSPRYWLAYRRDVRRIEKQVRDELLKLLLQEHVIPLDAEGLNLIADRIAQTLRQNLPD